MVNFQEHVDAALRHRRAREAPAYLRAPKAHVGPFVLVWGTVMKGFQVAGPFTDEDSALVDAVMRQLTDEDVGIEILPLVPPVGRH